MRFLFCCWFIIIYLALSSPSLSHSFATLHSLSWSNKLFSCSVWLKKVLLLRESLVIYAKGFSCFFGELPRVKRFSDRGPRCVYAVWILWPFYHYYVRTTYKPHQFVIKTKLLFIFWYISACCLVGRCWLTVQIFFSVGRLLEWLLDCALFFPRWWWWWLYIDMLWAFRQYFFLSFFLYSKYEFI